MLAALGESLMSNSVRGEPVRECRHPRAAHVHGTRAAYVADRCRCCACREANREAARRRRRAIAYGRWQPYVDASPVRAHVKRLRDAGLGVERIIEVSKVGSGTVRQLIYGDRRTGAVVRRVRPTTAARLLAIDPDRATPAGGCVTDSTGARRRLQALLAAGWSLPRLAQQVDQQVHSLRKILRRESIRTATFRRIADVYAELEMVIPPQSTVGQQREVVEARTAGTKFGWPPPLAWDDIDADPGPALLPALSPDPGNVRRSPLSPGAEPGKIPSQVPSSMFDPTDVDEVVVERVLRGQPSRLNRSELITAIDLLTQQGRSLREISQLLRVGQRTVSRRRSDILGLRRNRAS
jgi:hypothetical protein